MNLKKIYINIIKNPFKTMKFDFSNNQVKLGLLRFLLSFFKGLPIFSKMLNRLIHKVIIEQLRDNFSYVFEKYKNYSKGYEYDSHSPIWVCWFQGYDNAPLLVKKCIDSIKKSTSHPINIITAENIYDYIELPKFIYEKYEKKIISNAQFSDIIRMSLIAKYGGIWIDATVYIPKEIPEKIFQEPFFTCKRNIQNNSGYISGYRWTSFINGGCKDCIIHKLVRDLFYEYWKRNDYLIDYLLVDYFIYLAYLENDQARELIDNLQYNNPHIDDYQEIMDLPFDSQKYLRLVNSDDTYFYKLSWRMDFKETNDDGKQTFYGHFMNEL